MQSQRDSLLAQVHIIYSYACICGEGLLLYLVSHSVGEKWKRNRRLMNSTFTHKTITKFIPIFKDGTQALVEKLNECVGNGECEIFEIIKRTFLDMAMGKLNLTYFIEMYRF